MAKRIGSFLITDWDDTAIPRTLPEKMAAFLECEKRQAENIREHARTANRTIPPDVDAVLVIIGAEMDNQGFLLGLLYDAYIAWLPLEGKGPIFDRLMDKYRFFYGALAERGVA